MAWPTKQLISFVKSRWIKKIIKHTRFCDSQRTKTEELTLFDGIYVTKVDLERPQIQHRFLSALRGS